MEGGEGGGGGEEVQRVRRRRPTQRKERTNEQGGPSQRASVQSGAALHPAHQTQPHSLPPRIIHVHTHGLMIDMHRRHVRDNAAQ